MQSQQSKAVDLFLIPKINYQLILTLYFTTIFSEDVLYYPCSATGKMVLRMMNDLSLSVQKLMKARSESQPIRDFYKGLSMIKRTKKHTLSKFETMLLLISHHVFEPAFQELRIAISIDAGTDIAFDKIFVDKLKEKIAGISDIDKCRYLEKLFPRKPILSQEVYDTTVIEFTEQLFNKEDLERITPMIKEYLFQQIEL